MRQAMYACIHGTAREFLGECAGGRSSELLFVTHPHRPTIREWLYVPVPCQRILAAANLYSPLRHLVPSNQPRAGEGAIPRLYRTGDMRTSENAPSAQPGGSCECARAPMFGPLPPESPTVRAAARSAAPGCHSPERRER
jgi:hypothetical protein